MKILIQGKHNQAKVFTKNIDEIAEKQIEDLCNQFFTRESKIRIMPDTHAGAGCTIGTTMTIQEKIVPNLVGVDIGCGMEVARIAEKEIPLEKLDQIIKEEIPSGFNIRKTPHTYIEKIDFLQLESREIVNLNRARLSIGTLGGGNHFIEANQDSQGRLYLVIHSGSRNLGKQVADYYQNLAIKTLEEEKKELIEIKKKSRDEEEKERVLEKLKKLPDRKELAYLEGENYKNYLKDMKIVQDYAYWNRRAIIDKLLEKLDLTIEERFTTIHNYIDLDSKILRKGAISAQKDEKVIIPINMRDGSILARGKGNSDWNYSAPHGAGRILSRTQARKTLDLEKYKKEMQGIYTSSVSKQTLDEAPMAYKPIEEILDNTKEIIEILDIIKPIYNFKAK